MRKRSNDRIYDTLALVVLVIGWSWMWWVPPNSYQTQLRAMNQAMENSLAMLKDSRKEGERLLAFRVKKRGNKPLGWEIIKRNKLLTQKNDEVISKIEKIKNTLKATQQVRELMINQGKATEIQQLLEKHAQWLNKTHQDLEIPPVNFWDTQNVGTIQDYFKTTSPIAAISLLNQKQLEIQQATLIITRRMDYSDDCFCFDQIEPKAVAALKKIPVGDTYTADLLIQSFGFKIHAYMRNNGKPIVLTQGKGKIQIPTQKLGKFTCVGKITYRDVEAKNTNITINHSYEVLPK